MPDTMYASTPDPTTPSHPFPLDVTITSAPERSGPPTGMSARSAMQQTHRIGLFPSAADALGRQGFARIINHSESDGEAEIDACDDDGKHYGPLTLAIGAGGTVHFNSDDLETGGSGAEAVRARIVELNDKLLGVQVTPHSPDVDAAYRLFVNVMARGRAADETKANTPGEPVINHWAESDEVRQIGRIRYAPFASNEAFFRKYHRRMLVINGVDAQTNSHTVGIVHNWSGRNAEGYPKHVHKALRRYLGIASTPGAQRFPFNNTEDFAFFG